MNIQRRRVLGYALLALSTLTWGAGIVLTILGDISVQMASVIGALIIAGELLFLAAIALLGKDFYTKLKLFFARN